MEGGADMFTGLIMAVLLIVGISFIIGAVGLIIGLAAGILGLFFSIAFRLLPVIAVVLLIRYLVGRT